MDDQKCYEYSRLCVCVTKDGWSQLRLNFKGRRRLGLSIWVEEGRRCPDFHGPGWDSPSKDKQIMPWVHLLKEALPGTCLRFPVNGDQPSLQESSRCWLNLWLRWESQREGGHWHHHMMETEWNQRAKTLGASTAKKWEEEVKVILKREESEEVVNQVSGAQY